MARVTVEDCITKVPNRFELVMMASHRARELSTGVQPLVPHERDKRTVIALREIADTDINLPNLTEGLVKSLQKVQVRKEVDNEEILEILNAQNKTIDEDAASAGAFQSIDDGIPSNEGLDGATRFEDVDTSLIED